MQILNQQPQPLITIVGCLHGNEYIGQSFFNLFTKCQDKYPNVQVILANEPAIKANCRFIDEDLNRAFPGSTHGSHEQQLAATLLPHITSSRYVLDLHTTTSLLRMVPIVTNLNTDTQRIVNLCSSQEVAFIKSPLADKSLIGQCQAGVSLEYNADLAATPQATADVFRIVTSLIQETSHTPTTKRIYHVTKPVSPSLQLGRDTQNFVYSPALKGYPFLVGERAYPNGLLASHYTKEEI